MNKTLILLYHRLLSREENLSKINSEDKVDVVVGSPDPTGSMPGQGIWHAQKF
ncbi:MAG: hypothetical protein Q8O10_02565 [candidate division Zixibacteria bacterium]|nr:hypothetical protein [candidate division Zixibacteria bacterium]